MALTADEFRGMALGLPETEEGSHMDHPDFRVGGKIFATLGFPEGGWGMVKLTQEQQRRLVKSKPAAFTPANGAWGRGGATLVRLSVAGKRVVQSALVDAWRNTAPKPLLRRIDGGAA